MPAVKSKARPGSAIETVVEPAVHGSVNHGYTMKAAD
jgi:hypothetical protein